MKAKLLLLVGNKVMVRIYVFGIMIAEDYGILQPVDTQLLQVCTKEGNLFFDWEKIKEIDDMCVTPYIQVEM